MRAIMHSYSLRAVYGSTALPKGLVYSYMHKMVSKDGFKIAPTLEVVHRHQM